MLRKSLLSLLPSRSPARDPAQSRTTTHTPRLFLADRRDSAGIKNNSWLISDKMESSVSPLIDPNCSPVAWWEPSRLLPILGTIGGGIMWVYNMLRKVTIHPEIKRLEARQREMELKLKPLIDQAEKDRRLAEIDARFNDLFRGNA